MDPTLQAEIIKVFERASPHILSGEKWGDRTDEWSARITAAHPTVTGDHDTYLRAMAMVGNRHSKAALVDLVNWLLKGQP